MASDIAHVVLAAAASTQAGARACRSVSQECRQLVDSQVHSLRADLKSLSCHGESLPLHFPRLEHLAFDTWSSSSASESSDLLLQLCTQQPQLLGHLQELDLSTCQGLEADALSALLQAASSLHSLTLPTLSAAVKSSKQDFMHAISTHAKQLQHLAGLGDYVTADTLPLLAQLTALQTLDLVTERHALPIAPRSLQPLASLTRLHSLFLGNHLACHDVFELAAALPALQRLEFSYVREAAVSAQDLVPLTASKSLQRLVLAGVPCTDDVLHVLASTTVHDLGIQGAGFCATPQAAARMGGRLRGLQLQVNDATAAAVTAALPVLGAGLTSLSLRIHKATADYRGLLQAAFGLPALQQLALGSHYRGLSESEVAGLPVSSTLTQLSLSNHFSDATLVAVLRSAPGLTQLSLSSCGEVGQDGLAAVLGACKGLRSVRLELMRGVTAAGVAALAAGPRVRCVEVAGCRNVSEEECRELVRQLGKPELDILKLR